MALVIEWEGDDDVTVVKDKVLERSAAPRKIATAVGALAALVIATWGIRRLRAA